jgi:hypothetical protein
LKIINLHSLNAIHEFIDEDNTIFRELSEDVVAELAELHGLARESIISDVITHDEFDQDVEPNCNLKESANYNRINSFLS